MRLRPEWRPLCFALIFEPGRRPPSKRPAAPAPAQPAPTSSALFRRPPEVPRLRSRLMDHCVLPAEPLGRPRGCEAARRPRRLIRWRDRCALSISDSTIAAKIVSRALESQVRAKQHEAEIINHPLEQVAARKRPTTWLQSSSDARASGAAEMSCSSLVWKRIRRTAGERERICLCLL